VIWQTYVDLGLHAEARAQTEQALELHRPGTGYGESEDPREHEPPWICCSFQGKYAEAEALCNYAAMAERRVFTV